LETKRKSDQIPDMNFPVNIASLEIEIQGNCTQFIFQAFTDRLFLVITQYAKLGSLISIVKEPTQSEALDGENDMIGSHSNLTVETLLGKRDEILGVFAQQIAECVFENYPDETNARRSLLLALAVKDQSPELLNQIILSIRSLFTPQPL